MNATNSNSSLPSLPSRLRESSFRTYEHAIASAVNEFPNVVVWTKVDGSFATFAARLRDAMASLYKHNWVTDKIDKYKFATNYHAIKVSHVMPDRVVVGSLEKIKEYYANEVLPPSQFESSPAGNIPPSLGIGSTPTPTIVPSSVGNDSIVPVPLSQDLHDKSVELKLLAGLAALRLLAQGVEIEIDAERAEWLEQNYDVVLRKHDTKENVYIMS